MTANILHAWVEQAMETRARLRDEEIRRMLGAWVSELEPHLILRAHDSRLLGFTAEGEQFCEGPCRIHVYSSYIDPSDPHDERQPADVGAPLYLGAPQSWGEPVTIDLRP